MNTGLTAFSIGKLSAWMMTVAAIAVLATAAIVLESPQPAYADHDDVYAVCPGPIEEGDTGQIGVRKRGHKVERATFFTQHTYYTAGPEDFEEYHGFTVEVKGGRTTLYAPVVTTEDTLPEHDETFAVGFWHDGEVPGCVVTILDDDAPEIIGVRIISKPVDGYAYRAGQSIDIALDLDAEVDVEDTALLALFIGDGDDTTWRGAEYLDGSGTRQIVFRYRVQQEDFDMDGISVGAAAVADDRSAAYGFSGNIHAKGTDVPIDYAHAGVKGDWRQKVDGRPYVQSARVTSSPSDRWEAYRANQTIEVTLTFDRDVVVEGEVTVDLHLGLKDDNWDEATRKATYLRGSGSDTLVFGYTVQPGDMDPEGIRIALGIELGSERTGFDGSGTIKAEGTDIERHPFYRGTGHQPEHKVDTEIPWVSSVSITSQPANGEAYEAGETISVEVLFSEQVIPDGEPQLELEVGGTARQATLQSPAAATFSDSMVFRYDVQEGDGDSDGRGAGTIVLRLNGAHINDRAGNASELSHDVVVSEPGQKVDASREE